MKKLIFILLIFCSALSGATNYYVSTSGTGSGVGSQADPWTPTQLNASTLSPGDNVYIHRGDTIQNTLIIGASGTSGNVIRYSTYGSGPSPLFYGFSQITGWTNEGGGIYSKIISPESAPIMFTIDGLQYAMGRYPNSSNLTYESSNTNISITDNELPDSPSWIGAEAVIWKDATTLDRCTITGQSSGVISYTSLGTTRNSDSAGEYFIQNALGTLDQYGEWYYISNTLYVFFGSENPETKNIRVATIDNLVTNSGYDYIQIDSLAFEGSNSSTFSFSSGSDNCSFNDCTISFSGYDAFTLAGANNVVNSCTVSNVNGGGVVISGSNGTVTGNTFSKIGLLPGQTNQFASTIVVTISASTAMVRYNSVDSSAYMGIYFTSTIVGTIQYNKLHATGQLADDSGSIYLGHDHPGTFVDHNIILNSGGNGIYLDNECTGVTVTNNTVSGSLNNGIKLHRGSANTVVDNIFFDNAAGINYTNWLNANYLFDNVVTGNKVIAKSGQYTSELINRYTISDNFGTAENNYYVHISINNSVFVLNTVGISYNTLYQWTAAVETDYSSTAPTYSSESNLLLVYNDTSVSKKISLGSAYQDLSGKDYINITLEPYSSEFLIYTGKSVKPLVEYGKAILDANGEPIIIFQ